MKRRQFLKALLTVPVLGLVVGYIKGMPLEPVLIEEEDIVLTGDPGEVLYKEGTFTPVIKSGLSYKTGEGYYTRVGKLIHVNYTIPGESWGSGCYFEGQRTKSCLSVTGKHDQSVIRGLPFSG